MTAKKIAENVFSFLDKASALVGEYEAQSFSQRNYSEILESPINSPIEQLFHIAVRTLCVASYHDFNPYPDFVDGKSVMAQGVYLDPQVQVGKFRVDFVLSQYDCGPSNDIKIVVELDGHDFHDKDKHQRSYEKARDRFLVQKGYRVLHFTGAEVVSDPFKVAHEALRTLTLAICEEYDPDDPMGCGL